MDIKDLLNKLIQKQNLTTEEALGFVNAVVAGEVSDAQIGAVLTALRMKGETPEEIVGLIQAMRKHMLVVSLPDAIDVCGTGGDGSGTFNISTAVAFVVAGCDVKVAKHGNRAASSKSGSADVLEALGVKIDLSPKAAEKVFKKVGMVFLFAQLYHPAFKQVSVVRKQLGIRTIFNFLGPFASPASVQKQLIGVPDYAIAKKLAAVAQKLSYKHVIIVSSKDGMDEISLGGKTHVFGIKKNSVKEFVLDPKQFGFKKAAKADLIGGTAKKNAEILQGILSGTIHGAKRDIVLINSAVALVAADVVQDIESGIRLANQSIDNGAAAKVLQNLIKETQKYA